AGIAQAMRIPDWRSVSALGAHAVAVFLADRVIVNALGQIQVHRGRSMRHAVGGDDLSSKCSLFLSHVQHSSPLGGLECQTEPYRRRLADSGSQGPASLAAFQHERS